jgi:hypothetical protein
MDRPTKITFGELRQQGCAGIIIYCSDYKDDAPAPAPR